MQTNNDAFSLDNFLEAAKVCQQALLIDTASDHYLRDFHSFLDPDEIAPMDLGDAAQAAVELFAFAASEEKEILDGKRFTRVRPLNIDGATNFERLVIETVGLDRPFLVDSAIAALSEFGVEIQTLAHPIITEASKQERISLIQIHLNLPMGPLADELCTSVTEALDDVQQATDDFSAMKKGMAVCIKEVSQLPATEGRSDEDIVEATAFLEWLADTHFTFLGMRELVYLRDAKGQFIAEEPDIVPGTNLGILRDETRNVISRGSEPALRSKSLSQSLNDPAPIIVSKSTMKSRVHRNIHADYIGIKKFDQNGRVIGETRFLGLFTSDAYTRMAKDVPLIRRKVARALEQLTTSQSSYSERALSNVLETYPRDELFQISVPDLVRISQGILSLMRRPRTRLFIRRDPFDRYISVLMYAPRENYSTELRRRVHALIAEAFDGRQSAFYPHFSDGQLARVHYIVGLNPNHKEPDIDDLQQRVQQMAERWEDRLEYALAGQAELRTKSRKWHFSAAYKEAFSADEAAQDLAIITRLDANDNLAVRVRESETSASCKVYHVGETLDLSSMVPVLENMGLHVQTETCYEISAKARQSTQTAVQVHSLNMVHPKGRALPKQIFEEAFWAVWSRTTENDSFNRLIVELEMSWREAALMRALCRYRQQSGLDPSEASQVSALLAWPDVTNALLRLFQEKFEPTSEGSLEDRDSAVNLIGERILQDLNKVTSLSDDRVLRRLMKLIRAINRTNFYQTDPDGAPFPHISFKIASQELENLPSPKPFREIFVSSPTVEGVHLRFGPIARGGLRWSDRRDDFRTEVLGLVKAQQVKNAVIVPVGAKGGFYPKQLPADGTRDDIRKAGLDAYKTFIAALLQVTDNIVDGETIHPENLVPWDGKDPYLVVAADKGTATFSDTANEISETHGHWLGDAFASGGSAGYDHKKMGITARGAWEAVKRHFREMGKDIQTRPFSVIGVGDMSGDVFGNGMLLSEKIKLQAAFNHLHIFIDPDPDPATSFAERQRLFDLGRSSWTDYDADLISKGGGVFRRDAKSIQITDEIRELTGLDETELTPDELIRAILKTPAELLWFGGIGTYIKAAEESHESTGDRANTALRINADEVQAKVIGEGANLGVTQAGRIAFARLGGRVNTDAIDNSAGVDSSDHEVNIKILLKEAIINGSLETEKRDDLLSAMTEDVAAHVLRNNYDQTGTLSMLEQSAHLDLDAHAEFISMLESQGKLDRLVEGLPNAAAIARLSENRLGLTRPELSVLMSYAKIDLFDIIVASKAPDQEIFSQLLENYFPKALLPFENARNAHRLKREIIATLLVNRLVNIAGPSFPYQLSQSAGTPPETVIIAAETARMVFGLDSLKSRIDELDNQVPAEAQLLMHAEMAGTMRQLAGAFIGPVRDGLPLEEVVDTYSRAVAELRPHHDDCLSHFVADRIANRTSRFIDAGAPLDVAHEVASLRILATIKEVTDCALYYSWPLKPTAIIMHEISASLGIDALRAAARDITLEGHWERLAQQRVQDSIPGHLKLLTGCVLNHAVQNKENPDTLTKSDATQLTQNWLEQHHEAASRVREPALEFDSSAGWTLAKLVLVSDSLREFVQIVS